MHFLLSNYAPPTPSPLDYDSNATVDAFFPTPEGETLLSLATISQDAATVRSILDWTSVDDAWANWEWVDAKLAERGISANDHAAWALVKEAIASIKGVSHPSMFFLAPSDR